MVNYELRESENRVSIFGLAQDAALRFKDWRNPRIVSAEAER